MSQRDRATAASVDFGQM